MIVVVCSALITKDDKVLLVYEPKFGKYGLPGGKLEPGESLEQGLARECREEIGAQVQIGDLVRIIQKPRTHEGNTVVRFIYQAEIRELADEKEFSFEYYDQAQVHDFTAQGVIRGRDVPVLIDDYYDDNLTAQPSPVTFT